MGNLKQSFYAGLFSIITIGILTLLTYKNRVRNIFDCFLWIFNGSTLWISWKSFRTAKKMFSSVTFLLQLWEWFFLYFIPLPLYLTIPLAVGFGVGLMILFNVTHPPAGGNPIIVIMGSVSVDYLLTPVISGSIIILIFAIIINRLILKKNYPSKK